MARVLVTGGAGYIGSVLVPMLLDEGHEVAVLDSFMYDRDSLAGVCHHPGLTIVRGDVRVAEQMRPLLARAEVVIPLAALVGAPLCDRDPVGATTTNHDAVLWLWDALAPDQRVLMPITNSGYGVGESGQFCTEESPLRPVSRYGREKVAVERAMFERHPNSISFRLATVFGMSPRMRFDLLVNDFAHRAWRDRFVVLFEAHFTRNFIHVRDVARAFLHGLRHFDQMKGQAYNVGLSDANLSKLELCERIARQFPGFVYLESAVNSDPDQRNYIVSNEKIERTGFAPAYSLDAGIAELKKAFAMYRTHPFGNV